MLDNGTLVKILPAANLPSNIKYGRIVGVALVDLPNFGSLYLVNVHQLISDEYSYQVVGIFEKSLEVVSVGIYGDIILEEEVITPENADNYFSELGN